jgi:hypothetical protein
VSAENFLKQYLEPQLKHPGCAHPEIWLLQSEEVFSHSRAGLSIEWLRRFRELAYEPLNSILKLLRSMVIVKS